jgi:hypothetical protein
LRGSAGFRGHDWTDTSGDVCIGTINTLEDFCTGTSNPSIDWVLTTVGSTYLDALARRTPAFGPLDPNLPSGNQDSAVSLGVAAGQLANGAGTAPLFSSAYLSQAFIVPANASTLTVYVSSLNGTATAFVNVVANGVTTNLYTGIPPIYVEAGNCEELQVGAQSYPYNCEPQDPFIVIGPTFIDITAFRGQPITLQLGSSLTAAAGAVSNGYDEIYYTGVVVR